MSSEYPYVVTETLTALLFNHPFFATPLYRNMNIEFREDIETLGTDGNKLYINLQYFNSLSLQERIFAVAHEVSHAIFMHMARGKTYTDLGINGMPFDRTLFNVAADFIINDMLVKARVGTIKEGWLIDRRYNQDMSAEEVYEDLYKRFPPQPKGGGGGGGEGEGEGEGEKEEGAGGGGSESGPGTPQDEHMYATPEKSELEWKETVKAAAAVAKATGNLPANIARFAEEIVEPKLSWKELLRAVLSNAITKDETSWKRFNRRYLAHDIFLPSKLGTGSGRVVAGIDTSGSVSQDELGAFISEVSGILGETNPEELWVLSVDAHVHSAEKLDYVSDLVDFANNKLVGGGGTNMGKIFEWIKENDVEPDACVVLTDGYTPWGEEQPYSVIWVCTSEREAPHGRTIHLT